MLAIAAPVLCAGAEAEDVADEAREAEVARDDEGDALEDCCVEDEDIDTETECDVE
jgi:hypothetical protein